MADIIVVYIPCRMSLGRLRFFHFAQGVGTLHYDGLFGRSLQGLAAHIFTLVRRHQQYSRTGARFRRRDRHVPYGLPDDLSYRFQERVPEVCSAEIYGNGGQ